MSDSTKENIADRDKTQSPPLKESEGRGEVPNVPHSERNEDEEETLRQYPVRTGS